MKSNSGRLLRFGMALAVTMMSSTFVAGKASAQAPPTWAYSAKFVCGTRATDVAVVRGVYETSINIHNPHFVPVQFRKKAVIALPQRSQRGPISPFKNETLKPDEALGVDCADIRALYTPPAPGFIEGFLVIYIPSVHIDVVGVYTARERPGPSPDVADTGSIDVQPVTPIRAVGPNG